MTRRRFSQLRLLTWYYILIPKAVAQMCHFKKEFLEISQNSQENICARVSFLIKSQVWPTTLLKIRLWHKCFPVNFAKFLRTRFLQNTGGLACSFIENETLLVQMFYCEFCEISKNAFSYRAPPVAASVILRMSLILALTSKQHLSALSLNCWTP